jgi:tetratricopeptide (TPR) repeat protein
LSSILLGNVNEQDFVLLNKYADPRTADRTGEEYLDDLSRCSYSTETFHFDEHVRSKPDDFFYYYCRARVHINAKRYDLALANADVIGELHPTSPLRHVLRGDIFDRQGEKTKAIAEYDQAIKLAPRQSRLYYNRGLLYDPTTAGAQAEADFKKAAELDPKKSIYFHRLGAFYQGRKAWPDALAAYSRAIELDPKYVIYWKDRARARFLMQGNDNLLLAEKDYNEAITRVPRRGLLYKARALVLLELHKVDEACADLRKAQESGLDSRDLVGDWNLKEYDRAIAAATAALELHAGDPCLLQFRAEALESKMEWAKAGDDYAKAITLDGKTASYFGGRGWCLLKQSKFAEAESDFSKAIELNGEVSRYWSCRAFARIQLGKLDTASSDLAQATSLESRSPLAQKYLGLLAVKQKNYGIALERLNRAIELDAKDAEAFRLRAEVHQTIGEPLKANADKKVAEEMDSNSRSH